MKFLGNLEAFVSCSLGKESSVVVAWREKEATALRVTAAHAGAGVSDLDFHAGLGLLGTLVAPSLTTLICTHVSVGCRYEPKQHRSFSMHQQV